MYCKIIFSQRLVALIVISDAIQISIVSCRTPRGEILGCKILYCASPNRYLELAPALQYDSGRTPRLQGSCPGNVRAGPSAQWAAAQTRPPPPEKRLAGTKTNPKLN